MAAAEGGLAARLGGEEFGVLLPDKRLQAAVAIGQRMCSAVRGAGLAHRLSTVAPYVTVSLGVASVYPVTDRDSRFALLRAADSALYEAKKAGRDRIAVAPPDAQYDDRRFCTLVA